MGMISRPLLYALLVGATLAPIWLFRSGRLEFMAPMLLHLIWNLPDAIGGVAGFLFVMTIIWLPPTLAFVACYWPSRNVAHAPELSIYVLIGLWIFFVARIAFFEEIRFDYDPDVIAGVYEDLPVYRYLRKLDGLGLVLLTVWLIRRRGVIGSNNQLLYHWLLFACMACAAAVPFDIPFGAAMINW